VLLLFRDGFPMRPVAGGRSRQIPYVCTPRILRLSAFLPSQAKRGLVNLVLGKSWYQEWAMEKRSEQGGVPSCVCTVRFTKASGATWVNSSRIPRVEPQKGGGSTVA